jgi:methyl coenzyme M reductase gamma subunit
MPRRLAHGCCLAAVLLAAALTGTAGADRARLVSGHTAQGHPLELALEGDFVRLVRLRVDLDCRDGVLLTDDESGYLRTPLDVGRRFRDEQLGSSDVTYMVGRVTTAGVRGRVRVTDRVHGGVRCDSGWVRFSAGRGGA